MPVFEPPVVSDDPPYDVDASQRQVQLMRHFRSHSRGINVFELNDGTFRVDTAVLADASMTHPAPFVNDDPIGGDLSAFPGLVDSDIAYPWDIENMPPQAVDAIPPSYQYPAQPKNPFWYGTNWDRSISEAFTSPFIAKVYFGGHAQVITQAMALILTQAGFGDCINTDADAA